MEVSSVTKKELYNIAEQVGFLEYLKAAEEFERKECEKICKAFAMNERRVEVSAALNRAADMIRLRCELGDVTLPQTVTPKDFITYED
jgi:hypothetical protein